jgi:uncharacterized membrane protein
VTNHQANQDTEHGSVSDNTLPSSEQEQLTTKLTHKETRQIVTPYAFFVSDELLGTPLARPMRRGMAMLIDLICIALLTQISSLILALVAAATFFKAGNRLKTKKRFNGVRIFLRLLVALLLFVVAMGIIEEINHKPSQQEGSPQNVSNNLNLDKETDGLEVLAVTAKYLYKTKSISTQISQGKCQPVSECVEQLGEEIVLDVIALGGQKALLTDVIEGYADSLSETISKQQMTNLQTHLNGFADAQLAISVNENNTTSDIGTAEQPKTQNLSTQPPETAEALLDESKDKAESQSNGLLSWIEATLAEFGLGLGWAAVYFSVFTAWWKGQTPGKKLTGIKVIKLDNQPLSLWESFGRYGGYAAGFATGLSGFLQVLWDPNRQAIQDKISETLVIDLRKPKVPFVKTTQELV